MPEIDLVQVAQRLALLGLLSGIAGAIAWQLIWGALAVLAHRLHARAARRSRIAAARARALGHG